MKGRRAGSKRSDRRWIDSDGVGWASKGEWEVYERLRSRGYMVRKCERGRNDTFSYTTPVKGGYCTSCDSHISVVQRRVYTPDLFICTSTSMDGQEESGFYVETKGYFPATKRSLLRHFAETGPDIDLRVLAFKDGWVTKGKSRYSDYFRRYLKTIKFAVWDGNDLPEDWR